jgi:hypothetical protein
MGPIIQNETVGRGRRALVINEDRDVQTLTCWQKNSFTYKLIQNASTNIEILNTYLHTI